MCSARIRLRNPGAPVANASCVHRRQGPTRARPRALMLPIYGGFEWFDIPSWFPSSYTAWNVSDVQSHTVLNDRPESDAASELSAAVG